MLLIVWSYFHKLFEKDSLLSKNFTNSTKYYCFRSIKKRYSRLKVFHEDPIIPFDGYSDKNWNFSPTVHIQDQIGSISI